MSSFGYFPPQALNIATNFGTEQRITVLVCVVILCVSHAHALNYNIGTIVNQMFLLKFIKSLQFGVCEVVWLKQKQVTKKRTAQFSAVLFACFYFQDAEPSDVFSLAQS